MITFVDFCKTVVNLQLSDAWRVLLTVAVDGVEPRDLPKADRDMARVLFGHVDVVPAAARKTLVLRLGRGSGKSSLSAAPSIYAAMFSSLETVGVGMLAAAVIVAPGLKTAKIALRVARELVRASKLEKYVSKVGDSTESFELRRPHDGKTVTILAVAASRGGASLRGFDLLSILFDESEQFSSSPEVATADVHVSDRDLFAAASPRLHGLAVFASTPWPVATLTSELVKENYGDPSEALVAIGPSLLMRPEDKRLAARYAIEMKRDPNNARREFNAEDVDSQSGFFSAADVDSATSQVPVTRTNGSTCFAAVDLGFVRDASALCILEMRRDGTMALVHVDTVRPTKGNPIVPSLLFQRFAPAIHAHGCREIHSDSFNAASTRELVQSHGLTLYTHTESRDTKARRYMSLRDSFARSRVVIPNDRRIVEGLKSIIGKAQPGGTMEITAPRRAGTGHADAVSALVLAHYAMTVGASTTQADNDAVELNRLIRAVGSDRSYVRRNRGIIGVF